MFSVYVFFYSFTSFASSFSTPTMASISLSTTSTPEAKAPLRAPWRSNASSVPRQGHHSKPLKASNPFSSHF